jgi:DNA-binding CsgD family transcriptional regulator
MMSFVQHLLTFIGSSSGEKIDFEDKSNVIAMLDTFSRFMNQSIYWVDFSNSEFLYISSHPLFLCGYTAEEAQKMGLSFYEKVIAPEDKSILMNISKPGFRFFNTELPVEWRRNCYLSCDFRLCCKDGNSVLVNQKLLPFQLSSEHKLLSSFGMITPSLATVPGNAFIQNLNEPLRYQFSSKRSWFYLSKQDQLTPREKEVLLLCEKGNSNSTISEKLKISIFTVKQHKRNIFRKLGVSNASEAAYYALCNRMI